MSTEITASILRAQAWERAKAELQNVLHTFHSSKGIGDYDNWAKLDKAVEKFIEYVEDNGLQE